MKRILLMLAVSATLASMLMFASPASAQGGHESCRAFGQNVAGLATTLGPAFGQTAASGAPLDDTADTEQAALCEAQ